MNQSPLQPVFIRHANHANPCGRSEPILRGQSRPNETGAGGAYRIELRKRGLRRGRSWLEPVRVNGALGLSGLAVCDILNRHRAGEAISKRARAPARRDQRRGEDRALRVEQQTRIQRLICEKQPRPTGDRLRPGEPRPRHATDRTRRWHHTFLCGVRNDLKRWWFTPQTPSKRPHEERHKRSGGRLLGAQCPAPADRGDVHGSVLCH